MVTITASMVKELRERTGAGMMECKKALDTAQGDLEGAVTAMRKSGQAKAAKRAGRIAAEGIVALLLNETQKIGFIVEVNSETDFVARSEQFKQFVEQIVQQGLATEASDTASTLSITLANNQTIEDVRHELVAKLGENIHVRRAALIKANGAIAGYLHGDRIGVIVALEGGTAELARDVAMHIAATNPLAISGADLSPDVINKEREIFSAQAKQSGKPDNIIEKMVEGRVDKFLQEVCLVNQAFVKNPDQTIAQLLQAKQAKVTAFMRYEVGEGIEKQEQDFADEVRSYLGKDE